MIKKTEERQKREEKEYSLVQKVNGVMNTLYKRGYEKEPDRHRVIYEYIRSIGANEGMSVENACIEIQKDFDSFIRFIREQSQKKNSLLSSTVG